MVCLASEQRIILLLLLQLWHSNWIYTYIQRSTQFLTLSWPSYGNYVKLSIAMLWNWQILCCSIFFLSLHSYFILICDRVEYFRVSTHFHCLACPDRLALSLKPNMNKSQRPTAKRMKKKKIAKKFQHIFKNCATVSKYSSDNCCRTNNGKPFFE